MPLRFRKSIRIARGVKLNLSKSGGSFSFGGKGFTVNLGRKGNRTTFGIPGTGLSYSTYNKRDSKPGKSKAMIWVWTIILIAAAILVYQMH